MKYAETYPLVFAFFDGAFSANSAGRAQERDFERFSYEDLQQAELELHDFCYPMGLSARVLGMQADAGYTVSGQTHQNLVKGSDDEKHVLKAFQLLDEVY